MSFRKFALFFVFIVVVSALNAKVDTMPFVLADKAQEKADKIADIEGELKRLFIEASSSGDSKFKACVGNHFGTVKGLAVSANGMVSQIILLVTSGKMTEAQYQTSALSGLVDAAEKTLAKAQNCKKNGGSPAETDKNATSDAAAEVETDGIQQSENETSEIFFSSRDDQKEIDSLEEEEIVEQSPTE